MFKISKPKISQICEKKLEKMLKFGTNIIQCTFVTTKSVFFIIFYYIVFAPEEIILKNLKENRFFWI